MADPSSVEVWAYARQDLTRKHCPPIREQWAAIDGLCAREGLPVPPDERRFGDRANLTRLQRPRDFRALLDEAQFGRHEHARVLVVWRVDRLGRNLADAMMVAENLRQHYGFRILDCEGVDSQNESWTDLVRAAQENRTALTNW